MFYIIICDCTFPNIEWNIRNDILITVIKIIEVLEPNNLENMNSLTC